MFGGRGSLGDLIGRPGPLTLPLPGASLRPKLHLGASPWGFCSASRDLAPASSVPVHMVFPALEREVSG